MDKINNTITIIKAIEILFGVIIIPVVVLLYNLIRGMKCQLRNDMLQIYYKHEETKEIRQYELENFILLYNAYRSLRGNSFICKIYNEVMEWKVIS